MRKPVRSVADLGLMLRAVRKSQGVRLDDMAGSAGVGHVFAREVEHGKASVQMGRVLQLLEEAGLSLSVDLPADAIGEWESLDAAGAQAPEAARPQGCADARARRGHVSAVRLLEVYASERLVGRLSADDDASAPCLRRGLASLATRHTACLRACP